MRGSPITGIAGGVSGGAAGTEGAFDFPPRELSQTLDRRCVFPMNGILKNADFRSPVLSANHVPGAGPANIRSTGASAAVPNATGMHEPCRGAADAVPFSFKRSLSKQMRPAPAGAFLFNRSARQSLSAEQGACSRFVQCFHVDAAFSHGATDYYNIPLTGPTLGWI